MTEPRILQREIITEDDTQHREALRNDYVSGATRGDKEAGGAFAGGVAGAIVGAVVAGPVGAVVGVAIGVTAGATTVAVSDKAPDDTVITPEVRPS